MEHYRGDIPAGMPLGIPPGQTALQLVSSHDSRNDKDEVKHRGRYADHPGIVYRLQYLGEHLRRLAQHE